MEGIEMSDHIPDPTKMISDTPRTDAEEYESQDEPITKLGSVDAEFARTLERELNAANERIKRLEEGGDEAIYKTNLFDREAHWNKAKEAKP
jgi:uncharacterized protein YdcH (DUF465 family)